MSPLQWPRARKNKTVTVVDVDEESCSEFDDSPVEDSSEYDCLSCYSISGDDLEDSDYFYEYDYLESDSEDDYFSMYSH